jgi:hypothetical protein
MLFIRRLQPYPDVETCIGKLIGRFNGRNWWPATGKAQEAYRAVKEDLLEKLNTAFEDTYRSSVHFDLFVIGRDLLSAKPTIVFFCEEAKPREKAKKVLDESGILKRLPGFRTAHQRRQPNIGAVLFPAIGEESGYRPITPVRHMDVYYDPLCEIRADGMPIFVKQSNENWRKATAYRLFKDDRCYLMSVAHVFDDRVEQLRNDALDDNNDIDFGSEGGSDFEGEDQTMVTLPTTYSSPSGSSKSRSSESVSALLNRQTDSLPSDAMFASETGNSSHAIPSDQSDRLQRFGKLEKLSIDLDWALVRIDDPRVISRLSEDKFAMASSSDGRNPAGKRGIVCLTGRDKRPSGSLSANTMDIRLPGSRKFQGVYVMVLDEAIGWGDCGALVTDRAYLLPYGHIIASSEDMYTIFIIPAAKILKHSETAWETTWRMSAPRTLHPRMKSKASSPRIFHSKVTSGKQEDEAVSSAIQAASLDSDPQKKNTFPSGTGFSPVTTSTARLETYVQQDESQFAPLSQQRQKQKLGLPGDMEVQPGDVDTREWSNKARMVPTSEDSGDGRGSSELPQDVYRDEVIRRVNKEMKTSKENPSDRPVATEWEDLRRVPWKTIHSPGILSAQASNTQNPTGQGDEKHYSMRTGTMSSSSAMIMPFTGESAGGSEVATMTTAVRPPFHGPSQPKSTSISGIETPIGRPIARFGPREFCWEATGKVREEFKNIRDLFAKQIDEAIGTEISANDSLTFSLYMIGKNEASAVPTMLIISRNSDQRRAVKRFLDKGALLQRFPLFSIRSASKDPASTHIMPL